MTGLPRSARRLLAVAAVLAVGLAAVALSVGEQRLDPRHVVALACGIALGEMLRVDLAMRRGGSASFGLGDAALTAGLLLFGPAEVVLGAVLGGIVLQAVERVPTVKFLTNLVQYALGTAAATLTVHLLAPRGVATALDADIGPLAVGAVAVGIALFLAVNAVTVGGMIALTSGRRPVAVVRSLLPTGALLACGDMALGLLAVLLLRDDPWALPALAVPVVLLWHASRQAVHARVDRQRSEAFVAVEHALGVARTSDEVVHALTGAIESAMGHQAAVWQGGAWATPVPPDSTACPIDARLATPLFAADAALGPAVTGTCVAIGLGHAVLVIWTGELELRDTATDWIMRLGRSGRGHLERVAGAAALERERATLAAVVDGTGDGVLLLEPDGLVAVWNPAMAHLSGVTTTDATGVDVTQLLGEGPWQVEGVHDVVREHTEEIWRVAVAAIDAVDGPAPSEPAAGTSYVVAVHDVTAERRASQAREDMLAVVSHELRTPLTGIIASAQLLLRRGDRLDADVRLRLLNQVEDRGHHLARLVDDLLLVGQMSSARPTGPRLADRPLDVGDLVRDAVDGMRVSRGTHLLTTDVAEGCLARTDAGRLRQVLDNLIDNACKFSSSGTTVSVSARLDDDDPGRVVITVADEGRGIPPADLERVFEQFVRVEDPLTMTTSGAGLGLYIVRGLTESLGGSLELQSAVGVGTTVTLRLPTRIGRAERARTAHGTAGA